MAGGGYYKDCLRLRSLIQANLRVLLPGTETEIVTFKRTEADLEYIRAGVVQFPPPPSSTIAPPTSYPVPKPAADIDLARVSDYVLLVAGDPYPLTGSTNGREAGADGFQQQIEKQRKRTLESLYYQTEELLGQREKFSVQVGGKEVGRKWEEPPLSPGFLPRVPVENVKDRVMAWREGNGLAG